jgi:hypothetical protein
MNDILLIVGAACVVLAIVGGGGSVLGVNLPIVQGVWRLGALALVGCAFLLAAYWTRSQPGAHLPGQPQKPLPSTSSSGPVTPTGTPTAPAPLSAVTPRPSSTPSTFTQSEWKARPAPEGDAACTRTNDLGETNAWQVCLYTPSRQSMLFVRVSGSTPHKVSAWIQTVVYGDSGPEYGPAYACPPQTFSPGMNLVCYGGTWPSGQSLKVGGYGSVNYDGKQETPFASDSTTVP